MSLLVQVLYLQALGTDSFALISSLSFVASCESPSSGFAFMEKQMTFIHPHEDEI